MKHRYEGFLGEAGFSSARRRRIKGDFSKIPNSAESRFMGLIVANNNELPGNKSKKTSRKRKSNIYLDVFFVAILVVLWIVGYSINN